MYLDGGFEACQRLIRHLFAERIKGRPSAKQLKDAKTKLQEYLQSRQLGLPNYTIMEESGEAHRRWFKVACEIADLGLTSLGTGSSRRKAEQAAAAKALEQVLS